MASFCSIKKNEENILPKKMETFVEALILICSWQKLCRTSGDISFKECCCSCKVGGGNVAVTMQPNICGEIACACAI